MAESFEIIKKQIQASFKVLLAQLQSEQEGYFDALRRFDMDILQPGMKLEKLTSAQIQEFQLKHGLKIRAEKNIYWSEEYKKEVIGWWMMEILAVVRENISVLKSMIIQQLDFNSKEKLDQFLNETLERYHVSKTDVEGLLYCDEAYRKRAKKYLLKTRFDAIWYINEQYVIFPLEKRPPDNLVVHNGNYPFIDFDLNQWTKLEISYRVVPHLKMLMSITNGSIKGEYSSMTTKAKSYDSSIEYYSEVFKSQQAEDLLNAVLKEFDRVDKEGNAMPRGFQGVCEAFYSLHKTNPTIFKRNITMKKYIHFLRKRYKARIKSDLKLSNGDAYRREMTLYLSGVQIKRDKELE